MDFKSTSVNNCYILRNEVFNNHFFIYLNAKAVYSASIFHLAFFKGDIKLLPQDNIKEYEQLLIKLYRLNSPYLYIPFEINFHEGKLYQSYYESDHFPLSLWLEEKNLIPFDIFIRIIEDILYALKILEANSISHLFLTPDEILVPLQWTSSNHVKIYNVGINLLISSLMNNTEIHNYRKNYYKDNLKGHGDKPVLDISEDLYSFVKIMSQLFPFCNFNDNKEKNKLQKILNNILDNYENFNTIEEVIFLFDDYFSKVNRNTLLPDTTVNNTYSGQAGFIIPEFDEWKEEAELEILSEEIDKSSNKTIIKIERKSIYSSVASIFKRFFFRKKKIIPVSNTLQEYTNFQDTINTQNEGNDFQKSKSYGKENSKNLPDQTKLVIEKIDEHFTGSQMQNVENTGKLVITDKKNTNTERDGDTIRNLPSSIKYTKNNLSEIDDKFYINLNKSLEERNYKRTYELIQKSIKSFPKEERNKQELRLQNILDEKLKQLDNHYIINSNTNIPGKISKINKIKPMEKTKKSRELTTPLEVTKNNLNFFVRILLYIKRQIKKIIK